MPDEIPQPANGEEHTVTFQAQGTFLRVPLPPERNQASQHVWIDALQVSAVCEALDKPDQCYVSVTNDDNPYVVAVPGPILVAQFAALRDRHRIQSMSNLAFGRGKDANGSTVMVAMLLNPLNPQASLMAIGPSCQLAEHNLAAMWAEHVSPIIAPPPGLKITQ